jgi:hypothetical protein
LAGQVIGADEAKPATLKGTVVKVEEAKVTVKVGDKEVVVVTDSKTVVTLDGKDAKVADLKAGLRVSVTPVEGVATTIKARTPKAEAAK